MRGFPLRAYRAYRRAGTTAVALPVLVASLLVLAATGVPLIWLYRPEDDLLLQTVHVVASFICLLSTMAILGSRLRAWVGRPAPSASAGAVAALVALVVVAGGTGTTLAWVRLGIPLDVIESGDPPTRGVVAALSSDVRRIATTDTVMDRGTYVFNTVLHVLVLPLLLGLAVWRIDRFRRRARDARRSGEGSDGPDEGPDSDPPTPARERPTGTAGKPGKPRRPGKGTGRAKAGEPAPGGHRP